MATLNTTNALTLRYQISRSSQKSRIRLDSGTFGFPVTPNANLQELVLSPANPPTLATTAIFTVRSMIFMRFSGKVKITVTDANSNSYSQVSNRVFMLSVADPVTIEIETAETHNVSALIIWS